MVKGKQKFALWLTPEAKSEVESHFEEDNFKSQSKYIEKAIRFYRVMNCVPKSGLDVSDAFWNYSDRSQLLSNALYFVVSTVFFLFWVKL